MAEETVNNEQEQSTPVVSDSQPDLSAQLKEANERAARAELLAEQQKKLAEDMTEKFKTAKSKIGQYYDDRKQALEDQGAYKPLWEEANKTNQEMQQENASLKQQLEDLKNSYELATTKQTALSEIANQGAKAPNQLLRLIEDKIKKDANGKLVILDGGVEQDFSNYITTLKSPGSDWDHHFLPSNKSGMGAKPSPAGNTGEIIDNPYKSGNITKQIIMELQDPNRAAVLKADT